LARSANKSGSRRWREAPSEAAVAVLTLGQRTVLLSAPKNEKHNRYSIKSNGKNWH
jgi:hypothetical protein